ncbi:MAG TPA: hypothetical protein VK041_09585 [Opitutales bacterium]|nr:hypothetical protein [Opitutales bacterium]
MKISLPASFLRFYQTASPPCVSIYLPTHRSGPETRQDPIRLKNLLRDANEELEKFGAGAKADEILQPIRDLLPDLDFWIHQKEGLALFASQGNFRYFHLPYRVQEIALAMNRFYLKPLLPLFSRDDIFYILTLNKNLAQLYEANRYTIRKIDVPEMPRSMAEALQYDAGERQLQDLSFGPTIGAKGSPTAIQGARIVHGQGGEKDIRRDQILRYFRAINNAVQDYLKDSNEPLLLAGVDHYFPIYHEANTYPFLLEEGLPGGVDSLSETELLENAWPIARPHVNAAQKRMLERFKRVAYQDGGATGKAARTIDRAVVAAREGRLSALAIPRDQEVWGGFNEETGKMSLNPEDPADKCELLDFAAMQTILHGGELFVLPEDRMPADSEVAALLRYSVRFPQSA